MTEIAHIELTRDEARSLTDNIIGRVVDLLPLIKQAYDQRADRALGYPTWHDYCTSELKGLRVPLADRPAMVAELRETGMSTRAIGSALGTSAATVTRDLAAVSSETPQRVTGIDGQSYSPTRPEPTSVAPPATQMPQRQDVADTILSVVDQAWGSAPHEISDAQREAELDALMDGTVQRFRRNYAQAARQAGEITAFDPERIAEVFAGNFTRDVNDLLNRLDGWITEVRAAHRAQQRTGLRLVNGGQR